MITNHQAMWLCTDCGLSEGAYANATTGLCSDCENRQMTLWDEPEPERELTIQERFELFHEANPEVYEWLHEKAMTAVASGKKIGMKCLWEMLRWHVYIELEYEDEFRLNNDFTSRYARYLMDDEDDLDGYFEIRELRA